VRSRSAIRPSGRTLRSTPKRNPRKGYGGSWWSRPPRQGHTGSSSGRTGVWTNFAIPSTVEGCTTLAALSSMSKSCTRNQCRYRRPVKPRLQGSSEPLRDRLQMIDHWPPRTARTLREMSSLRPANMLPLAK